MLSELIKKKCLDEYWKRFSELVEKTWIEHMQVDKDTATKLKGRGVVKIITAKPNVKTKAEKESSIRNTEMHKAIEFLRQARRCEQINHRLERTKEVEPSIKATPDVLNKEAMRKIKKDLDPKDGDDRELEVKLEMF